jgi:predicted Zn-dependent protease
VAGHRSPGGIHTRLRLMNGLPAMVIEYGLSERRQAPRTVLRCEVDEAGRIRELHAVLATERAHRAAISAWPDSAGPTIQFAQRLQGWNRNADAFATYDAFLARQPRHTAVRYQVARLVAITGDHLPRGERILRELIADSTWEAGGFMPPRAAVHARLGDVLRKQGKRDEARTSYNTALSLDANSQIAKDGLAALRGS